jgi:hypothetical protein
MYHAVYKCRLCSETTSDEIINKITKINPLFDCSENMALGLINRFAEFQTTHYCLDGSIGIADFQ